MKKNLKISYVLFILTVFATIAAAQTEKGSFLISGSGSLDFASLVMWNGKQLPVESAAA